MRNAFTQGAPCARPPPFPHRSNPPPAAFFSYFMGAILRSLVLLLIAAIVRSLFVMCAILRSLVRLLMVVVDVFRRGDLSAYTHGKHRSSLSQRLKIAFQKIDFRQVRDPAAACLSRQSLRWSDALPTASAFSQAIASRSRSNFRNPATPALQLNLARNAHPTARASTLSPCLCST